MHLPAINPQPEQADSRLPNGTDQALRVRCGVGQLWDQEPNIHMRCHESTIQGGKPGPMPTGELSQPGISDLFVPLKPSRGDLRVTVAVIDEAVHWVRLDKR